MSKSLSPKRKAFVTEYMVDFNGTQAAIRAGYSRNGAKVRGSMLLANDNVQAAVLKAQTRREKRTEITADMLLRDAYKDATSSLAQFMTVDKDGTPRIDFSGCSQEDLAVLTELTQDVEMIGDPDDGLPVLKTRLKLVDRAKARDQCIRMLGAYKPNRTELTGANGGPIEYLAQLRAADAEIEEWEKTHGVDYGDCNAETEEEAP